MMPAQPHTPSENWRHSVYCGVQKGFPCTCKEPTWDDGGGVTSSGREQEREALAEMRQRLVEVDGWKWEANFYVVEQGLARLAKLEKERDAQAYRAEQHVRKWVESDAGKYEARAVAAEAESARLREALTTVRDWIRDGVGSESEAAEAMDAALSAVSPDNPEGDAT